MLYNGWIDRDGRFYPTLPSMHATEAQKICDFRTNNEVDAEKILEEQGWIRVRHSIPFYSSILPPSDIQKYIITNAYYDDVIHYRNLCKNGAALMFYCFFDDCDYNQLRRGEL